MQDSVLTRRAAAPTAARASLAEPTPTAAGAAYTCPMHPHIRQNGPGACPICGMALEPLAPSAEDQPNQDLSDMTRRFWIALVLTLPLGCLDMGSHIPGVGLAARVPPVLSNWIQCGLATPVVLWAGLPFFQRAWTALRCLQVNMFTLVSIGAGTAYFYSLAATIRPALFPPGFRQPGGTVPVYFEAAAVITMLVLLGQVLELRARAKTGSAIRALLKLAPQTARRLRAGADDEDIPLNEVHIGDRLRVRPGDAIPVDGVVLAGKSAIDQSMVTGESLPTPKGPEGKVIGGTINGTGGLVIRAEQVGAGTVLARIVAMVAEAQRSRAPIQNIADTVAGYFVPAVLAAAMAAFAAWALWGPAPSYGYALIAAMSVVMIACPCALGLATPMSIMVGLGRGAAAGVLIRSAESLQLMAEVNTLVVDKTGTLTAGKPTVTAILPTNGLAETDLLRCAASLEQSSEHPLAAAITQAAQAAGVALTEPADFHAIPGNGVTGTVAGRTVALGNARLMAALGIDLGTLPAQAHMLHRQGATPMFVGISGRLGGIIAVTDPIKDSTRAALDTLRADGIHIIMLTGDNRTTADAVGRQLGITDITADVLPQDKLRMVRALRAAGKIVAMAGDGVNDAPALAAADVGIAMGTGTEVAIQSASITLLHGDLAGIVRARALSRATMRNIRENLVFAFAYNLIGIPVAAGALYPAFGILFSPMVAALAMCLSSVSVIGNALRLRKIVLF